MYPLAMSHHLPFNFDIINSRTIIYKNSKQNMHFQMVLTEAITAAVPHNFREDQLISAQLQKMISLWHTISPLSGGHIRPSVSDRPINSTLERTPRKDSELSLSKALPVAGNRKTSALIKGRHTSPRASNILTNRLHFSYRGFSRSAGFL